MIVSEIKDQIKRLTGYRYTLITARGNAAISAALSILPKDKKLLIPEEGGWIHYYKGPEKLKLDVEKVKCTDAVIDVHNLKEKLRSKEFSALLYQQPGGYFAEQPLKEIYELCQNYDCVVIVDLSGAIGTNLWDYHSADVLVGSFGEGKLVEAHVGGFISCNDKKLFEKIKPFVEELKENSSLEKILEKLLSLEKRINYLTTIRKKVLQDLKSFEIVRPQDVGFVVVVKFKYELEKEKIIKYCEDNNLTWTECPRYIRLNQKAISIEIKKIIG